MIRLTALWLYVFGFSLYASKDWFRSLCALILLTAVVEHPDMPKSLFGIQGLSPWNILFAAVFVAWLNKRREEGLKWDLEPRIQVLLLLYLAMVLVGFARMILDADLLYAREFSKASMVSEFLINTIKWVVPGLMLYDGCRTRNRLYMGLASVLGVYFLLGVQVIKWMPFTSALSGGSLSTRSLKILLNEVGYHRVNISAMLAGASWAIFASRPLGATPRIRGAIVFASLAALYAQALTAGRAGYVTWAGVGFILCMLRWRKYLLLFPAAAVLVLTLVPGVAERMLEGFTPESWDPNRHAGQTLGEDGSVDMYTVTAGRTLIWPYVLDRIGDAPLIGYGRQAMVRIGLSDYLAKTLGEGFAHPHNAYFELLLDNGLIGFLIVIPFYAIMVRRSIGLFRDSRQPVFVAVGGASAAIVLALLIAGMGSQTFYPREGWMGMWCLFGLMLRVYAERARWDARQPEVRAPTAHRSAVPVRRPNPTPFRRPAAIVAKASPATEDGRFVFGSEAADTPRRPAAAAIHRPVAARTTMTERPSATYRAGRRPKAGVR